LLVHAALTAVALAGRGGSEIWSKPEGTALKG
jgi:hypothetical protein